MRRCHVAKKTRVDALTLANRLMGMVKKVAAGDTDPDLRRALAELAAEMGLAEVEVAAGVYELAVKHSAEIGVSKTIQDPGWRDAVGMARGTKKTS